MAGINHVIGIENGRGYYIRGNVEIDVEALKEQDVENDGNLCAVCAGKSNGIHFGSASCAACNAFLQVGFYVFLILSLLVADLLSKTANIFVMGMLIAKYSRTGQLQNAFAVRVDSSNA